MASSRLRLWDSSVATKILIGITGLSLFIYLVIHVLGNLMVFFGPAAFNRYAYTLEGNPLIPVIEIGLLLIFLLHVYKTIAMYLGNQRARPARYQQKKFAGRPSRKSIASSTMIFSGLWLLVFIVIHVKAFRVRHRIRMGRRRTRSLSSRDGEFQQSADGRVLRAQHDRRRLAPVARNLERVSVPRRR